MNLRQLPGATVLGLVAALVAHAALFGGEHTWAGAYHSAFLQFTLAATAGLVAAAGALLWSGAQYTADGTVLAARLRPMLPGWGATAACAAGWYVLGERLETAHAAVPLVAIVGILLLAAWAALHFASAALRLLAGIVFAITTALQCRARLPFDFARFDRYARNDEACDDNAAWSRRFSRPPPVRLALTRA